MTAPTETKVSKEETTAIEDDGLAVLEGELVADAEDTPESAGGGTRELASAGTGPERTNLSYLQYVLLPLIFLTVALVGGIRISSETGELIFVVPALICLVFATILLVLFVRTGLIRISGWFGETRSALSNAANAAVLLSVFSASVQMFNSLIPEQGLAFWIVAFCFLWSLGMSYFAIPDPVRLIRSTTALFVLAFLTKYFVLLNLTSASSGSWLQRLWDDPTKEAVTYLLDLPRYAPSTGYIQFFGAALFLLGLFLLRPEMNSETE